MPPDEWVREFSSSKFCLAIRGDTPHTHALLNAVKVGCIPVVISDMYPTFAPSFPSTLKMGEFCIFISEAEYILDPAKELLKLMDLSEEEIRRKIEGLAFMPLSIPPHKSCYFSLGSEACKPDLVGKPFFHRY
jgi:hypothetical protein